MKPFISTRLTGTVNLNAARWKIPRKQVRGHGGGGILRSLGGIGANMRRVTAIRRAGEWPANAAADRVVLDSGDRHRRRIVLEGECGTSVLLDSDQPVLLRDGDGLILDDGAVLAVVGACESLLELAVRSPAELVRLAWHVGNRHADLQVEGDRLRIRRDHVLEEMAIGLGATVAVVEAVFNPEGAAERDRDGYHHD